MVAEKSVVKPKSAAKYMALNIGTSGALPVAGKKPASDFWTEYMPLRMNILPNASELFGNVRPVTECSFNGLAGSDSREETSGVLGVGSGFLVFLARIVE